MIKLLKKDTKPRMLLCRILKFTMLFTLIASLNLVSFAYDPIGDAIEDALEDAGGNVIENPTENPTDNPEGGSDGEQTGDSSEDFSVSGVVNNLNKGDGVYAIIKEIMGIMSILGFAIAMFKLIQIGIQFILGAGRAKSDAKAALMPWLVGAIVCIMFGTIGPWVMNLIMGSGSSGIFDI